MRRRLCHNRPRTSTGDDKSGRAAVQGTISGVFSPRPSTVSGRNTHTAAVIRFRFSWRLVLRALVALGFVLWGTSCTSGPVSVTVPLAKDVRADVLSLQVTSPKHFLGILSPRARYAKEIRAQLRNELIKRGFVIKSESAKLHVHGELVDITTGGTQGKVTCELRIDVYPSWPGHLSKNEAAQKRLREQKPIHSFVIHLTRRKTSNADVREAEVQATVREVVQIAADQLLVLRK